MTAALDHLFKELISNVLHVCFMTLPTDERREEVELLMLENADANSLQHDGRFLNWKKKFTGLRGMSMSTRVGLLIKAVPLFEREHTRSRDPIFLLPLSLIHI